MDDLFSLFERPKNPIKFNALKMYTDGTGGRCRSELAERGGGRWEGLPSRP
jgi:hypothetical protein